MHLYSAFLMMKLGPWIQAKAQIDGGAVKGIGQLIQVNSEIIVLDVKRPGLIDENLSEFGINAPVSFFIGISQCRLGNRLADAGVMQLARKCSQTVFNVTGAFPASELSKTHDQKVLPASKLPYSVVALVLIDTLLELIFWQKLHQLCKNGLPCIHTRSNNRKSESIISSRKIFKTL
jgi:hypothetical protein